jgi:hypothetical protein
MAEYDEIINMMVSRQGLRIWKGAGMINLNTGLLIRIHLERLSKVIFTLHNVIKFAT